MNLTDNTSYALLSKALDLTKAKNKVIANNIANANTPGYKKYAVSFQDALNKAVDSKNVGKIKNVHESVTLSSDKSTRKDGNNVDLDNELVAFYRVSDRHNMYLEIMSQKFKGMLSAIHGR